jgi:tRNA modification GTPase
MNHDPIIAIATAAGRGGIGIIRLSGKNLDCVREAICAVELKPRYATYVAFLDEHGQTLDKGIALFFPAPHSYTGEQVLELHAHGGPVILQILLKRCLALGRQINLRLAAPGEFTQRAYLNDKLDLAQAEAVADLIEASTEKAARCAARSLEGCFSKEIEKLVAQLIQLRTLVEATLDFPTEELDFLDQANAQGQLQHVLGQVQTILQQAKQGAILREGLTIVLAGKPNVGKSSLLNALVGKDIAIVTPIAGTTRDQLQQTIHIEGIPLHIIDTAGLRETDDAVERIGVARSWQTIANADVILHLYDVYEEQTNCALAQKIAEHVRPGIPLLRLINKIDLALNDATLPTAEAENCLRISAKTGQGIDTLRHHLLNIAGWQAAQEGIFLARERHLQALQQANAHLLQAQNFLAVTSFELLAEELRLAQENLSHITGIFTSDDLLGEIFNRFCIGK